MHTRDDRKKPGIKRPFLKIPNTLEGEQCFCITIPGGLQNKLILLDVLQQTTWWFSYQRTAGIEGKTTADRWRDLLDLPRLTMCCCPDPTNQYYDTNGILQLSYDGGATYTPATDDPRFNAPLLPALPGDPGDVKRCTAANQITGYIKAASDQLIADGTAWNNITTLLAALGAIIVVLLSIGTAGVLTPLILGLVSALVGTGLAAFTAAMTEEVWSELACIIYCHTPNDAVYTEANWQAIKSDVASQFDGIVEKFIYDTINAMGLAGLNNASRAGVHAGQPCDLCACDPCERVVTFDSLDDSPYTIDEGQIETGVIDGNALFGEVIAGDIYELKITILTDETCTYNNFTMQFNATNTRPIQDVGIQIQYFDNADVLLRSAGDPSIDGAANGITQTFSDAPLALENVAYIQVQMNWGQWSVFGGSGQIDNLHLS